MVLVYSHKSSQLIIVTSMESMKDYIPKIENSLNSSLKGLCSNCENIETCNLQRTDDIVINCEEYR